MKTIVRRLTVVTLLALALPFACHPMPGAGGDVAPAAPSLELRSYDVPRAYSGEVVNVVNSLLYRGKDVERLGSVALSPGGQMLVAAPASFHAGVDQLVSKLKSAPVAAPPAVEMSYWIVLGRPAEETKLPAEATAEVLPALKELIASQGPMELTFFDQLKLRSSSGDRADVESPHVGISQSVTVLDDKVLAEVDLHHIRGPSRVRARTQLETDKLLVLAEAGFEAKPGDPFYVRGDDSDARTQNITAFYILRAHVVGR
jgi:hypothetical protein